MKVLGTGKIPPVLKPCIARPINKVSNEDELTVMVDPIGKVEHPEYKGFPYILI
jgi:hypothetical protein